MLRSVPGSTKRIISLLVMGLMVSSTFGQNSASQTGNKDQQKGDPASQSQQKSGQTKNSESPVKVEDEQEKLKVKGVDRSKKQGPTPSTASEKIETDAKPKRRVGSNYQVPANYQPVIFEDGPFVGLESFGYSFFAAAREWVANRSKSPILSPGAESSGATQLPVKDVAGTSDKKIENLDSQKSAGQKGKSSSELGQTEAPVRPAKGATLDPQRFVAGPYQMSAFNFDMPVPERYLLGAGDQLSVRFYSPTVAAKELITIVDQSGNVVVPITGRRLVVRGMTLAQAEKKIETEVRRYLKNATVELNLNELRTISVSIVGEVIVQGSYQFPATMTLFNALFAAGGPTINGSMRNIQVRRSGGKSINVDLYSFFLSGDASQDIELLPGDLILVPVAQNRIGVRGEVIRPGVYEAKASETVKQVLNYAGGSKPSAVLDRAELATVRDGASLELLTLDLRPSVRSENPIVQDSDVLTLYPVRDAFENIITVDGEVDQPRDYQFKSGMRISDAISLARGLLRTSYGTRADVYRLNPDKTSTLIAVDLQKALQKDPTADIVLQKGDRIKVYSIEEISIVSNRIVEVEGAVKKPQTLPRMEGMRVGDALLQVGGFQPEASLDVIFIQRKNLDGTAGPLLKVNGIGALKGVESDNPLLQDRDKIIIYTVDQARFVPDQKVEIYGAVRNGGIFPFSADMTLRDVLLLAGGFLPSAGDKIQVAHSRTKESAIPETYQVSEIISGKVIPKLQAGDIVTVPADGNFVDKPLIVEIRGRVKSPGVYAIQRRQETVYDLIQRAGGLADDAWPLGGQFLRDPQFLSTEAEKRLSPRVREILTEIQQQEYVRALAKSDIDKFRALNNQNSGGGIGALGALTGQSVAIPSSPANGGEIAKTLQARETVSPARTLSSTELFESGNVPIRIDLAMNDKRSIHNIVLRDGDIVTIPDKPSTVGVRGAVIVPTAVLFENGKTLGHYLSKAGGYTTDADTNQILIIRATGTITKARASTRIELGDTIFVPTKVMVARISDGSNAFENVVKQITNTALLFAIFRNIGR